MSPDKASKDRKPRTSRDEFGWASSRRPRLPLKPGGDLYEPASRAAEHHDDSRTVEFASPPREDRAG
jgi:hypothetical protein